MRPWTWIKMKWKTRNVPNAIVFEDGEYRISWLGRVLWWVGNRLIWLMRQNDRALYWSAKRTERKHHKNHGRGDEGGPFDSDCGCRGTDRERVCAISGCGFCRRTA